MFAFGLCHSLPSDSDKQNGKRARILIMSQYRAQIARLTIAIASLSKSEYCPNLVDIRTVDTAMGDTTDIAILDLTRSKDYGFMRDCF
jgi:hypothetical protein